MSVTRYVISFSTAVSAYEKGSQQAQALTLLMELREQAQAMVEEMRELSVISFSTAVFAYEKGSQQEQALALLVELQEVCYHEENKHLCM